MKTNKKEPVEISAEEFDHKFEAGEDISEHVDWSKSKIVYPEVQRVNVDFPGRIVAALDREANRRGITRQALIKTWITDNLDGKVLVYVPKIDSAQIEYRKKPVTVSVKEVPVKKKRK